MTVASEERDVTGKKSPDLCMICKSTENTKSCEKCGCGCYCSEQCMVKHKNHAIFCSAICSLEEVENQKRMKREIHVSDSEKLPFKMKRNLVRLVGERPLVNVFLNGVHVQGLWDTGAMIN